MIRSLQSAGSHADLHRRYLHYRAMRKYASFLCKYRRLEFSSKVHPKRARTASQIAKDIETGSVMELASNIQTQDGIASTATTVVDFQDNNEKDAIAAMPPVTDFATKELARQVESCLLPMLCVCAL